MRLLLLVTPIVGDNCVDCFVEDVLDAAHLLAAAFHVSGSHLSSDRHTLLLGNRCKTLGLEKIDTGSLCSEIRLEANQDERCVGAEVQDLGVPLVMVSIVRQSIGRIHTLSMTFSRELGQSMAKQTKRRSVSGYDRGRRRSYSSWPAVSQSANSKLLPLG